MAVEQPPARIEPYGFEKRFEEQVVYLLCSEEDFYRRVGFLIEPEALADPLAQELAKIVHRMVEEGIISRRKKVSAKPVDVFERRAAPPKTTPLYVVQRLNQLSREEGRILRATVNAAMDYVERLTDEWDLNIDEEAVIALLAPELKRRLQNKAIMASMETYRERKGFKAVIALLDEAERLGDPEAQVGADALNLQSVDTDKAIEALQTRQLLPTGIQELDKELEGGISESALLCVLGAPGAGKCHEAGQGILLYDGRVKKVEDVQAGDLLMGPDSLPRRVLCTNQGHGRMYEICPQKGDSWRVNLEHVLTVLWSGARNKDVVFDVSVHDYMAMTTCKRERLKLFRAPADFEAQPCDFPLEPYFLGILLGDGGFSGNSVGITTSDAVVIAEIGKQALKFGLHVRIYYQGVASYYGLCCELGQRKPIISILIVLLDLRTRKKTEDM